MPNPRELQEAWSSRVDERWLQNASYRHMESHADWRADWRQSDAFMRGEWVVEMPDGTQKRMKPYIENRVRTIIEDKSKIAAQMFPTMRVEAPNERGTERAQTREQLIQYYHQMSHTPQLMSLLFADMMGPGLACIKVWPDFNLPKDKRFPRYLRVDPRDVLPPPGFTLGQVADDVISQTWRKVRDLKREFPAQIEFLINKRHRGKPLSDTDEIMVIRLDASDEIAEAAYIGDNDGVMLFAEQNRVKRCPLILVPRPTADGRLRGQFGDVLPALAAENRVFTLITQYVDQAVNAPILTTGMQGIDFEFGPGAKIDAPEGGNVGRIPPATVDASAWRFLADAERHSRRGAAYSEARSGDVQASIISGTALDSLQGPTITDVASLQQQMELGLELANEVAQEVDRTYCDAKKTIIGYSQGGQFQKTYTPSEAIREGDVSNIVTYGAGASIDKFNRIIMLLRMQEAGWASRRWAAVESGMVDNYLREENRRTEEQALDALLAGVYQQASQGNLEPLARFWQAREDKQNPLEVLADIVASQIQAQSATGAQPQPLALPGEATPGQQAAAAQTGAPGGGTALPSLSSLLLGG